MEDLFGAVAVIAFCIGIAAIKVYVYDRLMGKEPPANHEEAIKRIAVWSLIVPLFIFIAGFWLIGKFIEGMSNN